MVVEENQSEQEEECPQPSSCQDGDSNLPPVHFLVTGFGKFPGVPANPTEVLVERLASGGNNNQQQQQQQQGVKMNPPILKTKSNARLGSTSVLKVSAKTVCSHLQELSELVGGYSESDTIVVVHFGVDVCAQSFKLERRAFNEANFRLPDEDGFQSRNEPISVEEPEACSIDSCLHTKLDVAAVVERLRGEGFDVQVSHDAGRYVCNYTYFSSLKTFEGRRSGLYSLFVHVPSFHAIDAQTQNDFVAALFDALASEARARHSAQQIA
jgi:pyroglutamyl-peptidase